MAAHSAELFARAQRRIPGGVNSPVRAFRGLGREPFFVERASGANIWDVDGKEYIDYVGTWGPAILGHAPRVVIEAVRAAGFDVAEVDPHGFRSGSMNDLLVRARSDEQSGQRQS